MTNTPWFTNIVVQNIVGHEPELKQISQAMCVTNGWIPLMDFCSQQLIELLFLQWLLANYLYLDLEGLYHTGTQVSRSDQVTKSEPTWITTHYCLTNSLNFLTNFFFHNSSLRVTPLAKLSLGLPWHYIIWFSVPEKNSTPSWYSLILHPRAADTEPCQIPASTLWNTRSSSIWYLEIEG
jgi:hypothetical protein